MPSRGMHAWRSIHLSSAFRCAAAPKHRAMRAMRARLAAPTGSPHDCVGALGMHACVSLEAHHSCTHAQAHMHVRHACPPCMHEHGRRTRRWTARVRSWIAPPPRLAASSRRATTPSPPPLTTLPSRCVHGPGQLRSAQRSGRRTLQKYAAPPVAPAYWCWPRLTAWPCRCDGQLLCCCCFSGPGGGGGIWQRGPNANTSEQAHGMSGFLLPCPIMS